MTDPTIINASKAQAILNKKVAPPPPTAPPKQKKSVPELPDFRVFVDEDTGSICVTGIGYRFDKSIVLTMDELPDRYQAFFAKYILCK